jgi:hypothetical protein
MIQVRINEDDDGDEKPVKELDKIIAELDSKPPIGQVFVLFFVWVGSLFIYSWVVIEWVPALSLWIAAPTFICATVLFLVFSVASGIVLVGLKRVKK